MSDEIEQLEGSEQMDPLQQDGDSAESEGLASSGSPRNRGSLVIFVLMIVGMGGIYLMRLRTGPASAMASSPNAQAAEETINRFLTNGQSSLQQMRDLITNTEKVVDRFKAFPAAAQVPLSDLHTNPFRLLAAVAPDDGAEAERKKKEEEKKKVLAVAQSLKLQSIMFGDTRRACMINDMPYSEGQEVQGLTIERILPSSIIVKGSGYRFEIRMQH